MLNRRTFMVASAAAASLAPKGGFAQDRKLTILSHKVHENVSRGLGSLTAGGDIAGEWAAAKGVEFNWITADIDPLHDRLQRELALGETSVDVAFILNKFATPRMSGLLSALNDDISNAPIDDYTGIPGDLIEGLTFDGKIFAIPFRHATVALHYDEVNLADAGIDAPPTDMEDMIAKARKATRKNANGDQVYGLVLGGGGPFTVLTLLAGFGAELIDQNLNVKANSPEMIGGFKVMRELFEEGVLPPDFTTISIDGVITLVQQGRTGFTISPFARYGTFNDPKAAAHPGKVIPAPIPASVNLPNDVVAMTEIWAMVIPENSRQKDLSWDFIRHMSSPDAARREALNGNGPIRPAAYDDPGVQERLPYWKAESEAIANATMLPSSYDQAARAGDVFVEEFQAALLGFKTAEDAATSLQERVEKLVAM